MIINKNALYIIIIRYSLKKLEFAGQSFIHLSLIYFLILVYWILWIDTLIDFFVNYEY